MRFNPSMSMFYQLDDETIYGYRTMSFAPREKTGKNPRVLDL